MSDYLFISKSLPYEIQQAILPYDAFTNIREEPDFYGASELISSLLGLKRVPRSYSSWSHGWGTAELKFKEQIAWNSAWKFKRLVRNRVVADFLLSAGVQNAVAVGLPITYVPSVGIVRRSDSVLFMPAHALSYVDIDHNLEDMIVEAESLRSRGCYVCFCIHSACVKNGKTISLLNASNLDWFVGSSVQDINSLQRMRNVFEYFGTVASNTIGSHFVYSQLFGAKFFFTAPYFEFHPDQFLKDPFLGPRAELREFLMLQSSFEFIKRKHPLYFNGYENAICDQGFAAIECGVADKREPEVIAELLGWGVKDQIICPIPYFGSKVLSKIKKVTGV